MKKIILTIILVWSMVDLFGQNLVFPTYSNQPTWRMVSYDLFSGEPTWITFRLGSDTTLCEKTYQRIMVSYADTNNSGRIRYVPFHRVGFVRNENSKVFFRKTNTCTDKEYLMYDFSLKKGDSTYCGHSADSRIDTTKFYVTDVDSIVYEGIKRKRLKVWFNESPNCTAALPPCPIKYNMWWIEGIGTSHLGGFYPYMCLNGACEEILYFICYEENSATKFQNPEFPSCNDFRTPTREINKSTLNVHLKTNNITDNLIIENTESGKIDVHIVNTLGQILITKTISNALNSLNINHLSNGLYLIVFTKNNQRHIEKFVKN